MPQAWPVPSGAMSDTCSSTPSMVSSSRALRWLRQPLRTKRRSISVQADKGIQLTETLPYGVKRVFAYRQSGQIGAYQAGFRGNGARIAILDTGIDLDHPELAASIDNAWGKNCITLGAAPNDGHGHGSHVSGTAAAPINGVGGVGVAPQARLVAVKMSRIRAHRRRRQPSARSTTSLRSTRMPTRRTTLTSRT